jgi:hypothetical protein
MTEGNRITITWSSPSVYQSFQIAPVWNGQAVEQGQVFGEPAPDSWTEQTSPGDHYSFSVEGGVYQGASDTYDWSAWGPSVEVTAVQNLHSLREFLEVSNINSHGFNLRSTLPANKTLRQFMQL